MKQNTEWHKTCKCECRLDASVCNNKQRWNNDKCRCKCKDLIDKGVQVIVIVNIINHVMLESI